MSDTPLPARRPGRPPSAGTEPGAEVQSLDRAMAMLEIIAGSDGMSLSEIGRQAGLPSSTVHRLLSTLERRELVRHDAENGLWTVGAGAFRMGAAYLRVRKLPELARPLLRALVQEVDETVNLSLVEGDDLVCVAQAESHAPVRAFFRLGCRLPVHASGAGKSILAAGPDAFPALRSAGMRFERFTPNTHGTRAALEKDLDATRRRGFAIDDEEHTLGMRCVAAAIFDEWREPIGAVSISAPVVRMPAERLALLGDAVKRAAEWMTEHYCGAKPDIAGTTPSSSGKTVQRLRMP